MITIGEFLNRMPGEAVRQAATRLMDVAEENGGLVKPYRAGVSIRCAIEGQLVVSIAWLYPPDVRGWMRTRDFSFGYGRDGNGNLPEELSGRLRDWSHECVSGINSIDVSNDWAIARSITHEEAAANIDVLAERLANILRALKELGE